MKSEPEMWLLYSTFATHQEAVSAARALLEARLIACANILPAARSIYCWEGVVREEEESVLFAKTVETKLEAAISALKSRHSYTLPCIVSWRIEAGLPEYLQWVRKETGL